MTRIGLRLVLLIAIGATIGCDRVTKHMAALTLSEASSRSFLAVTFRLEYVENTGAFLGLGADWPLPVRTAVFSVGNGVLLLAVAVVAMRSRWPRRSLVGVAIFVAKANRPAGRAVESRDRIEDAGLAGAIGSDDGRDPPGRRSERYIAQSVNAAEIQINPFDRKWQRPAGQGTCRLGWRETAR